MIDAFRDPFVYAPVNERRHYIVTSSLIGWAHAQNDPGCIATSAQPASYLGSQSYISGQLDHAHFNVTADNNSWLIPGPNSLDNNSRSSWWRHQMVTSSALLAICVGNSPVAGEFPAQRPVTRRCDVFFDLRLNTRLRKQSWGWWFETILHPLWRHCNDLHIEVKWCKQIVCCIIIGPGTDISHVQCQALRWYKADILLKYR